MLNALRLKRGFTEAEYSARTGLAVDTIEDRLTAAAESGLIEQGEDWRWRPTALGLRFQNDLTASFLP